MKAVDPSGLIGRKFVCPYDGSPIEIFAVVWSQGEFKLIVSRDGGPLHESSLGGIKPISEPQP